VGEIKRYDELLGLYVKNMNRLKWRMKAVSDVRCRKKVTTYDFTDAEFCILQYRKILELIALSSLVSDADVYREKLGRIEKMWNAKLILKDIERIHPNFYPVAVRTDPNDKLSWIIPQEPCLTKEKFITVYDKCGKYLHETSPFLADKELYFDTLPLWENIFTWERLIINLLSAHNVYLYNSNCIFHINMGGPDVNTSPIGWILSRIDDE